jgi:hypothetical protein
MAIYEKVASDRAPLPRAGKAPRLRRLLSAPDGSIFRAKPPSPSNRPAGSARVGRWLMVIGTALQAVGLGLDGWLHLHDAGLIHHEALVTFHNPGHVLLMLGFGVVVIGAFLALFGTRLDRLGRRTRLAAPVMVGVLLVGIGLAAAHSDLAKAHQPLTLASDHVHTVQASGSTAQAGSASPFGPTVHSHADSSAFGPVDPATEALLEAQLNTARASALRYPTLADALKAGYIQAAGYASGIGSHYMKYSLIGTNFDVANPAMLLFNGDDPKSVLVGVMYYVYDAQGPPDGFAGPYDVWHTHPETCVGRTGAHFVGDDAAIECGHRGRNGWMVHAWVVPGWESIQGVFSDQNSKLP